MTSPTLTDLLKGNGSLSLSLVVISHLVVPFSAPFLLYIFTAQQISLDIKGMMLNLALIIVLPLILATVTKKIIPKVVEKSKQYISVINIFLLALLIYTIVATNGQRILNALGEMFTYAIWLYVLFVFLHIIGYYILFWRNRRDKIAVSCSKMYMNDALALVIAAKFFTPEIVILMALCVLTRNTMPLVSKWGLKYLK